ncbi:MAG: SIS domain-containing protein [Candidatus Bathyarchaeia archaeon]
MSAIKCYQHNMIREILEEPDVIRRTLIEERENIRRIAEDLKDYEIFYVTGSGTSYHAGLASQYALSSLTGIITSTLPASEFHRWVPQNLSKTKRALLMAISQSGESTDIVSAAKAALRMRIDVLAITNTPGSTLANLANYVIYPRSGREEAIPATKTYIAQLAAIFMLTLEMAELKIPQADIEGLREGLYRTPEMIEEIFASSIETIRRAAEKYRDKNLIFILGSGPNYATALEGALKLKETCMIFSEGFATREFLHGPIRLIDERTLMIIICASDEAGDYIGLLSGFKGFGANVISVLEREEASKPLADISDCTFYVPPGLPKVFSPMVFVVPIQIFTYYMSVFRGLNPDRPEKLMKVVR